MWATGGSADEVEVVEKTMLMLYTVSKIKCSPCFHEPGNIFFHPVCLVTDLKIIK
jgi:hypothetical protein